MMFQSFLLLVMLVLVVLWYKWQPTPAFLAGESQGEGAGGLPSRVPESDTVK